MRVLILMAAFEGEPFLREQIQSIQAQTHKDWRLLIRDDGSSDGTPVSIRELAQHDPRLQVVDDTLGNLGPAGNFAQLMQLARADGSDAFAFADQDDLWAPQKLERQLAALAGLQQTHGAETPALVHSDLALIDSNASPLADSFMARQRIRQPAEPPLLTLLLQNHLVGCSMLINRTLLELATPVPARVHMHDWWIALCAASAGVIAFLPEPLVQYRQHGGNRIGAHGLYGRIGRPDRWIAWLCKMNRIYRLSFSQAAELRQRLIDRQPPSVSSGSVGTALQTLNRLLALTDRPRPLRPLGLLNLAARCQNTLLTTLFYTQSALLKLPSVGTPKGDASTRLMGGVRQ